MLHWVTQQNTKQLLELQRNSASVDINPRFKKAQLTQFYLQSFISDSQTYKPDFKAMHEGAWANLMWQLQNDPAVPSFSGIDLPAARIHMATHREASTEGQSLKATDQLPPPAGQVSYSASLE